MQLRFLSWGIFAYATCVLSTACTSRAWYESASSSAKFECNKLQPGAREDCLAKVNNTPYDSYEKERTKQAP